MRVYQYSPRIKEDIVEVHDGFKVTLVKLTSGKKGTTATRRKFIYEDKEYRVTDILNDHGHVVEYDFERVQLGEIEDAHE